MNQINCLNPQIIVNPLAKELIAEHKNFTFLGSVYNVQSVASLKYLFDENFNPLSPLKKKVTRDHFDKCFITDRNSGECYPLFMEVACGSCDCCKSAKINALVHRCKLETMYYDCQPIFLTLTYNEKEKPKDGVSLRDCQLFFKRLRINLYRKGYRFRIRYLLVSEYGKTSSRRPHYHAILWNLHETDFFSYRDIIKTIESSWNKGFCCSRLIDTTSDKAFSYTAKYLGKGSSVPEGQNKTFICSSNRGGGIGSRFIDLLAVGIKRELNKRPQFCNKFTNSTDELQLNRYVLNRIFPSFFSLIPSGLKKDVRNFLLSYRILRDLHNVDTSMFELDAVKIIDFFRPYFYCPELDISNIPNSLCHESINYHYRTCIFAERNIVRAMSKGRDFYDYCRKLDDLRQRFLSNLFKYDVPVKSLEFRAINFRRSMSLAKQREVL